MWPWARLFSFTPDRYATLAAMAFFPGCLALIRFWGSRLGGCLLGLLPLLGLSPLVAFVAGSPLLVCLCTLRVHYSLVSGISLGLLALLRVCSLHMDWVFSLFFFLRPLLFCFFLGRIPWLCCAFSRCLSGRLLSPVALLPWPASLSLGPWVSCVSWFSFSSFLSFAHRTVRTPFPGARGSSLPVGVPFPAASPGGLLGAPPWAGLLWGIGFF